MTKLIEIQEAGRTVFSVVIELPQGAEKGAAAVQRLVGSPSPEPCCPDWRAAQEPGTTTASGWLLTRDPAGDWRIGRGLAQVVFCPWCGRRKT